MAVEYMTPVRIPKYDNPHGGVNDIMGYEYDSGDIDSGSAGDWILIPDNVRDIICTLEIDSGEGKLQTTTNKVADVISDNDVVPHDWDNGSVTENTQDKAPPVTAIRLYRISGTIRLMVRAQ